MPKIEISGMNAVIKGLGDVLSGAPQAVAAALTEEAERIMADSKTNYVPVDLGTLKDSGTVLPPEFNGRDVLVSMGYGGAASAYAEVIHEYPNGHNPISWREHGAVFGPVHFTVGGPKYLERPFLAATKDLLERLADRLRPYFGG